MCRLNNALKSGYAALCFMLRYFCACWTLCSDHLATNTTKITTCWCCQVCRLPWFDVWPRPARRSIASIPWQRGGSVACGAPSFIHFSHAFAAICYYSERVEGDDGGVRMLQPRAGTVTGVCLLACATLAHHSTWFLLLLVPSCPYGMLAWGGNLPYHLYVGAGGDMQPTYGFDRHHNNTGAPGFRDPHGRGAWCYCLLYTLSVQF